MTFYEKHKKLIIVLACILVPTIAVGIVLIIMRALKKGKANIDPNRDYKTLPFIEKVKENQEAFGKKVIAIAGELGIKPDWIMIVMNNESGINHRIKNPNGSATGLIQFTEATAKGLGTSTAELAAMTNVEQLDYVKKYFGAYANKINNAADAYLAVFYPQALFEADNWSFPQWAVTANHIFFKNGNTKGDFNNYVKSKYGTYYA